jgi:hypothetical protein
MFDHCSSLVIERVRSGSSSSDLERMLLWAERNKAFLDKFIPVLKSDHVVLFWSSIMGSVFEGIHNSDQDAIRVSLKFIYDDPKVPFGKTIKQRLLKKLRQRAHLIGSGQAIYMDRLIEKLSSLDYPPQELNDLIRLRSRVVEESAN